MPNNAPAYRPRLNHDARGRNTRTTQQHHQRLNPSRSSRWLASETEVRRSPPAAATKLPIHHSGLGRGETLPHSNTPQLNNAQTPSPLRRARRALVIPPSPLDCQTPQPNQEMAQTDHRLVKMANGVKQTSPAAIRRKLKLETDWWGDISAFLPSSESSTDAEGKPKTGNCVINHHPILGYAGSRRQKDQTLNAI